MVQRCSFVGPSDMESNHQLWKAKNESIMKFKKCASRHSHSYNWFHPIYENFHTVQCQLLRFFSLLVYCKSHASKRWHQRENKPEVTGRKLICSRAVKRKMAANSGTRNFVPFFIHTKANRSVTLHASISSVRQASRHKYSKTLISSGFKLTSQTWGVRRGIR